MESALDPAKREPYSVEIRFTRPTGEVCWAAIRGRAVFDDAVNPPRAVRLVGVVQEVKADRAITALVAMTSPEARVLLLLPLAAQAGGVDKLHKFLDATHSFRAEFLQTVVAKSGRKPQLSAGLMLFSRPGKFRWTYEKPYEQVIVGDGVRKPDLERMAKEKGAWAYVEKPYIIEKIKGILKEGSGPNMS